MWNKFLMNAWNSVQRASDRYNPLDTDFQRNNIIRPAQQAVRRITPQVQRGVQYIQREVPRVPQIRVPQINIPQVKQAYDQQPDIVKNGLKYAGMLWSPDRESAMRRAQFGLDMTVRPVANAIRTIDNEIRQQQGRPLAKFEDKNKIQTMGRKALFGGEGSGSMFFPKEMKTVWGEGDQTYQGQTQGLAELFGAKGKTAKNIGIVGAPIMLGLDLVPGGGGKDDLARAIAKSKDAKTIAGLIKKAGQNVDPKLVQRLVKETDPKKIGGILDGGKKVFRWFDNHTKKFIDSTDGRAVDLGNGIEAFIQKNPVYKSGWQVVEPKTGMLISDGSHKTQKEAIESATSKFKAMAEKGTMSPQQLIDEQLTRLRKTNPSLFKEFSNSPKNVGKVDVSQPLKETYTNKRISLGNIKARGTDGSFDPMSLEYSKSQIKSGKQVEPIIVRKENGKYLIEDGEHRFRAYKELGYKGDIEVKVIDALSQPTAKKGVTPKGKLKVQPPQKGKQPSVSLNPNEQPPSYLQPTGKSSSPMQEAETPPFLRQTTDLGLLKKSPSGSIIPAYGPNSKVKLTKQEQQNILNRALYNADDNKNLDDVLTKWLGKQRAGEISATEEASKFARIPADQAWDTIRGLEGKKVNPEVSNYVKNLRVELDNARKFATDNGIDIGYIDNYAPHIWKEKPVDIIQKAKQKGMSQSVKYANERVVVDYDSGIKMGLTPKFTHPAQILQAYKSSINKAVANIEAFNKLKESGLAFSEVQGSIKQGVEFVKVPGLPNGGFYTPGNVADKVRRMFAPEKAAEGIEKIFEVGGKVSRFGQEVTLSGGVPGTPFNFFGLGAVYQKELLSGNPVKPVARMIQSSLGDKAANKFFSKHTDTLKDFAEAGFDVQTTFDINRMVDKGKLKNIFGDSLGAGWHKAIDDPTFKRFYPMVMVDTYERTFKNLSKNLPADQAKQIALKAVDNFYNPGKLLDEAMQSKSSKDIISTFFFAPKYRRTLIGWYKNLGKSALAPLKVENRKNATVIAAAALTYLVYNKMNQEFNGKNLWENPPGKEDKLLIPDGKGGYLGIPFLPSLSTMPRMVYRTGNKLLSGDIKGAAIETKNVLSMPIKTGMDVLSNEDYFGSPIYDESDEGNEKLRKIGGYVAKSFTHPYVRGGIDLAEGKKPGYQIASESAELPIRFYSKKSIDGSYYYAARDKYTKGLTTEERKQYEAMHSKKEGDKTAYDSLEKAATYLKHPRLFEVDKNIALETAKKTGAKADPLYNLTPDQARKYFQYQTMPFGGADKKDWRNKNQWYTNFSKQRSAFFDSLPKSERKDFIEYPDASPEVDKMMDTYYSIKDPKQRSQFMKANPQLQEQWDKQAEYTNQMRIAQGYSAFKKYPKATPKLQAFIDQYMSASKQQRKGLRNANPQMYINMSAYFDSTSLYNIGKEGEMSRLQGNPDASQKLMKNVDNLARDIYQNPDGSYSITPAGWFQGMSDGGGFGNGNRVYKLRVKGKNGETKTVSVKGGKMTTRDTASPIKISTAKPKDPRSVSLKGGKRSGRKTRIRTRRAPV